MRDLNEKAAPIRAFFAQNRHLLFCVFIVVFGGVCIHGANAQTEAEFVDDHLAQLRHSAESYYGGSREAEVAKIAEWLEIIRTLHDRALVSRSPNEPGRPFHHESGGVIVGHMVESLPEDPALRTGLFARENIGRVVVLRFSNGVARNQHDLIPDVRGLTPFFLLYNRSLALEDQTIEVVSLPMTNGKGGNTLIGDDIDQFVAFADLMSRPGLLAKVDLAKFLLSNPGVRKPLVGATLKVLSSRLYEEYGTGHSYKLGDLDTAYKARIVFDGYLSTVSAERPHYQRGPVGSFFGGVGSLVKNVFRPNYLRDDLYRWSSRGRISADLQVQTESHGLAHAKRNELIEHSEKVWGPEFPFKSAVTLSFPRQERSVDLERAVDSLNLSPTGGLGLVGRARSVIYEYSASIRGAVDPKSPEGQAILRGIIKYDARLRNQSISALFCEGRFVR